MQPFYLVLLYLQVWKSTKLRKVFGLQDRNLANLQFGIYVDDIDLTSVDMTDMPNYAIGLRAEAGVWVETADKKYRAYIYINSVNATGSAVISMLRYTLWFKRLVFLYIIHHPGFSYI